MTIEIAKDLKEFVLTNTIEELLSIEFDGKVILVTLPGQLFNPHTLSLPESYLDTDDTIPKLLRRKEITEEYTLQNFFDEYRGHVILLQPDRYKDSVYQYNIGIPHTGDIIPKCINVSKHKIDDPTL